MTSSGATSRRVLPGRRRIRSSLAAGGLGALALVLSGCGSSEKRIAESARICPRVDILEYTRDLTQFIPGPGRDVTDIVFRGRLVRYTGECKIDKTTAKVELLIEFALERGPASRNRAARFQYFVAIPQFHPLPIGKRVFPVSVPFEDGQRQALFRDEITITIPIEDKKSGRDYNVFVGFQLDPDQLEYNRRRVRR